MLGGLAALGRFRLLPLHFPLLVLLQLLRLLSVLLLHLVLLLLLVALELVMLLLIRPLSFQFLLLLDVPLLHFLALRVLVLAHLFYFFLLFLLQPRIDPRSIRRPRRGRTIFGAAPVTRRWFHRTTCLLATLGRAIFEAAPVIRGRLSRTICFPRVFVRAVRGLRSAVVHSPATVELSRPRSRGNVWPLKLTRLIVVLLLTMVVL